MSDLHPDRECHTQCGICDKSLGRRRRMHIPQEPKERMLWAIKEYNVPQDSCICANCALQIKLGYQEPTTLYEPSKGDDKSATSEEDEEPEYDEDEDLRAPPIKSPRNATKLTTPVRHNSTPLNIRPAPVQIRNNLPANSCYLARYTQCEATAMWNVAASDWGSFAAAFDLERYKEEELPHNISFCHPHYCQHTAFKIPKCALCGKKTTVLRTNGQLYMKAYKLTPAMDKYCRANKVKIAVSDATRLCTRCYQRVGQQVNNPKKTILPRATNAAVNNGNSDDDDIQIVAVKRKQTPTNNGGKSTTTPSSKKVIRIAAATTTPRRPASGAKLKDVTKPSGTKLDVLLVCEDEALTPEQQAPLLKYAKMKQQHATDTTSYYKTHSVR